MSRCHRGSPFLVTFAFLLFTTSSQSLGQQSLTSSRPRLTPHAIALKNGDHFNLNLPLDFEIAVAVQGLKRVRFMAESPDHRIFVTDMFNLTDNRKGTVYILDQFDPATKQFKSVTAFMSGLRNPNSVAFLTDEAGHEWFYLALTDRLLRYRYEPGSTKPTTEPEVLATFPDYGLGYKYGGWHLTRTIAVGENGKIYVAVGSSCNACVEKEEVRASIIEMDPDGKNQRHYVRGLRNAVGLRWIDGHLHATNMGADHLGINRPADVFMTVQADANYGWPYCYQFGARINSDPKFNLNRTFDCRKVPLAQTPFAAHSSPLGFAYFDQDSGDLLKNAYLVALHGSTRKSLARGYRVVRVRHDSPLIVDDFITGFIEGTTIHGRPADVFRFGDGFLLSDDRAGVIYYVYPK